MSGAHYTSMSILLGRGAVLDVRTITLTEMKMCLKCFVLINFVWTIRDLERFCLTGNLNPMENIFLLTLRKNNCVVIGKLWVHLTSPMRPRRQSNNDHHYLFIFWPFVHDVTNHVMLKPTPSWSATVDLLHGYMKYLSKMVNFCAVCGFSNHSDRQKDRGFLPNIYNCDSFRKNYWVRHDVSKKVRSLPLAQKIVQNSRFGLL